MTGGSGPERSAGPGAGARRRAVLVSIALGLGVMATGTSVWVRSAAASAVDPEVPLAVTGALAAPGVNAGGLVVVAAGFALALGGRWGRRLAAAAITGGGLLVAVSVAGALADPRTSALSAAQEAVGVAALAAPVTVMAAPWAGLLLGVLVIAHGLRTAVVCGRWQTPSGRYEASAAGPKGRAARADGPEPRRPAMDDHGAWDALTEGQDPT